VNTTAPLRFERLHIGKQAGIFKGLDGKVMVFSCCHVGADRRVMETIKEASGAAGVIAYRVDVYDCYANLAEVMLFDRLISNRGMSPSKAVELVAEALSFMKVPTCSRQTRGPVMVCV